MRTGVSSGAGGAKTMLRKPGILTAAVFLAPMAVLSSCDLLDDVRQALIFECELPYPAASSDCVAKPEERKNPPNFLGLDADVAFAAAKLSLQKVPGVTIAADGTINVPNDPDIQKAVDDALKQIPGLGATSISLAIPAPALDFAAIQPEFKRFKGTIEKARFERFTLVFGPELAKPQNTLNYDIQSIEFYLARKDAIIQVDAEVVFNLSKPENAQKPFEWIKEVDVRLAAEKANPTGLFTEFVTFPEIKAGVVPAPDALEVRFQEEKQREIEKILIELDFQLIVVLRLKGGVQDQKKIPQGKLQLQLKPRLVFVTCPLEGILSDEQAAEGTVKCKS
ncbi:MAG: hypothetical protein GMKNLPBB_01011 [Myxococcota bacterium]|nr:hypothetical protein [Myxococcota bacterium]